MVSLNKNPRGADNKARSGVWKVEGTCVFGGFPDEDLRRTEAPTAGIWGRNVARSHDPSSL